MLRCWVAGQIIGLLASWVGCQSRVWVPTLTCGERFVCHGSIWVGPDGGGGPDCAAGPGKQHDELPAAILIRPGRAAGGAAAAGTAAAGTAGHLEGRWSGDPVGVPVDPETRTHPPAFGQLSSARRCRCH